MGVVRFRLSRAARTRIFQATAHQELRYRMKDSQLAYDMVGRDSAPLAAQTEKAKQFFLISLLLATWLPIALFLALSGARIPPSLETVKFVVLFFGTAHVPATLFFYLDKGFSEVIRHHKTRYVYLPVAVTVLTGLVFAFSSATVQGYVLLLYWGWQAFHYGRQNVGVYAFAAIAQTGKSPRRAEKLAIDLGTACGVMGTFKILGMGVAPPFLHPVFNFLYVAGGVGFLCVLVFTAVVYIKYVSDTTLFKTLFFFTSVFFFFPVFISTELNVAFLSYAMAHGFQYLVFMLAISLNAGGSESSKMLSLLNALKVLGLIVTIGLGFTAVGWLKGMEAARQSPWLMRFADFLVGAILGTTMAHFLIDAGAWKLSMTRQRAYITERFNFLFNRRGLSEREGAARGA
jgi:hypothetical protein